MARHLLTVSILLLLTVLNCQSKLVHNEQIKQDIDYKRYMYDVIRNDVSRENKQLVDLKREIQIKQAVIDEDAQRIERIKQMIEKENDHGNNDNLLQQWLQEALRNTELLQMNLLRQRKEYETIRRDVIAKNEHLDRLIEEIRRLEANFRNENVDERMKVIS